MIATIYRPPKAQATDDTALYEEVKSVIQNKQVVIIGDFNCHSIDWTSMNGDRESNRLIETEEYAFLTQIVTQPTRENNILDLAFASDPDLLSDCKIDEKLGSCDYYLTRFNIKKEYTLNKTKISDYRKANFNRARQLIPPAAWNQLNLADTDTAWTDFKNKLLEVERAADTKWAINRKKRNYNLTKEQATAEASEQYHRILRACQTLIR